MQELRRVGFRWRVAQFEDVVVLSLWGELDLDGADALCHELEALEGAGGRRLIADLAQTTFVDPAALDALLASSQRLGGAEGSLLLVADEPRTLRMLAAGGLGRVFEVRPTLRDAIGEVLDGVGA